MDFTHLDDKGSIHMVNVGYKDMTQREAIAQASVIMNPKTMVLLLNNRIGKGNVITTAKIAGIMAAKSTDKIIPLCHSIMLSGIDIEIQKISDDRLQIISTVSCQHNTGVEMEAIVAVSTAAITIYDMCKAVDRGMKITDIVLLKKRGGKSGVYQRPPIVKGIYIKDVENNKLCLAEAFIHEDGIEGEKHKDGIIVIMDEIVLRENSKSSMQGLCFSKFYAHIVVEGADFTKFKKGDKFKIGNAEFMVERKGKKCFPECKYSKNHMICELQSKCMYATIVKTGKIRLYDSLDMSFDEYFER